MAKRPHYVNPFSMGLLGGIADWAKSMEKYNAINAQNEARQRAYETKYKMMGANFAEEQRQRNNALIAKMGAEYAQREYLHKTQDADGNTVITMGHMVPDPKNPGAFIPHDEWTGSVERYNKEFGKGGSAKSDEYTLTPGSKRMKGSEVIAENVRPDTQSAIQARQLEVAAQKHKDTMELAKTKQDRADLANKVNRVETLTQKDLDKFDNAGTAAEKRKLLKQAGVDIPDKPGVLYGTNPPSSDEIDAQRSAYEDAMRAKHAKNLGVSDKQLEEGPPAPAVEAEGGDTTGDAALPEDHVPDIRTGKDGKQYKIMGTNPDGTIKAVPLAMDTVDTGDAVAQAGGEEAGETAPDNEASEPEDPYSGLLEQYAQASDAGLAQAQSRMTNDQDQELEPAPEDENSLLAG